MNQMINYHKARSYVDELKTFCQPLQSILGVTGFGYHQFYDDGSEILLSNDPVWLHCAYQNNLTIGIDYIPYIENLKLESIFWPVHLDTFPALNMIRQQCNWYYGLTFYNGASEAFGFSIINKNDSSVMSDLMNHHELLERFCYHFSEKAQAIIQDTSSGKNPITRKDIHHFSSLKVDPRIKSRFIEATPITDVQPIVKGGQITPKLTATESVIISDLLRGMTNAELAANKQCSRRTIEYHINNLKDKFQAKTRSSLIQKIYATGVASLYI